MPSIIALAPDPLVLRELVAALSYRPGWTFSLVDGFDRGQGCSGLTLIILVVAPDSYDHARTVRVQHFMPVPGAAYDLRSWRRWLLDQILLVEQHEACEYFKIGDARPYAPNHAPGRDPWTIVETGSADDATTSYLGARTCVRCGGAA
jgi:hypothetical protein